MSFFKNEFETFESIKPYALNKTVTRVSTPKSSILLFVGILSAPLRKDRRNAIRETWMTKCKVKQDIACVFVTDSQNAKGQPLNRESLITLLNESLVYNDLVLAESPAGGKFWSTSTLDL